MAWTAGRLAQELRDREAARRQAERHALTLEAEEARTRQEMEIARRVQDSLLPVAPLAPPGLTVATFSCPAREQVTAAGHSGIVELKGLAAAADRLPALMARTHRLTTVLMLLVTFLVAGLLPVAGSWSCPDGTACVYTPGRGFHCVGDECRMPCCVAAKRSRHCGRCDHGPVPGIAAPRTHQRGMGEPARCRYREGRQREPALAPAHSAPVPHGPAIAVLPTPVQTPAIAGLGVGFTPAWGSLPSSDRFPLSSPRAPPGPDCA